MLNGKLTAEVGGGGGGGRDWPPVPSLWIRPWEMAMKIGSQTVVGRELKPVTETSSKVGLLGLVSTTVLYMKLFL